VNTMPASTSGDAAAAVSPLREPLLSE
jgi:hypothetical protein